MRRMLLLTGLLFALPFRGRAQNALPNIPSGLVGYATQLLARLIESTREQAIADGVQPVPTTIYRGLLGYFPDGLLRKARFASGRRDRIAVPSLAFSYGDAAAMTVGEVVLFRDAAKAQSDLKLWAHELTHVLQYQRWGIEGFAERYVRDSQGVEREAYENADRFAAWHARR